MRPGPSSTDSPPSSSSSPPPWGPGIRSGPGLGIRATVPARTDPARYRRLQSDMQRAADSYLAVLSQLNDVEPPVLRHRSVRRRTGRGAERLDLPDVAPGGRSSARIWLHNTTSAAAVRRAGPGFPRWSITPATRFPADAVTFVPDERRPPRRRASSGRSWWSSTSVRMRLPGTYHGQVLVERLPDVVFPLTVQ